MPTIIAAVARSCPTLSLARLGEGVGELWSDVCTPCHVTAHPSPFRKGSGEVTKPTANSVVGLARTRGFPETRQGRGTRGD